MSTDALKRYSVDEFLALEQQSDVKHEYFDGEIFAMAGATVWHNLIAGNVARHLGNALTYRGCRVLPSDMMVLCPTGLRTYPDVTVVCEKFEFEFEDETQRVLINPQVIVEVLSDTTEAYDRGRKFDNYRSITSLREYVLVSQSQRRVDHFARQSDGQWLFNSYDGESEAVKAPSLQCAIRMPEIYAGVEFSQTPVAGEGA